MTAMNVFSRPDGAWLIADTGHYDAKGRVLWFGSKIISSDRLRLAITSCGRIEVGCHLDIRDWLERQPDQVAALSSLPDLLRLLDEHDQEAESNGALEGDNNMPRGIRLAIAFWDAERMEPRTAIIATTPELAGGAEPFSLRPVRTMFCPPLPVDHWPGHSFDPRDHAKQLAEVQRFTPDGEKVYRVGGAMEAVRIGADGIERMTVAEWGDRLDHLLRPVPTFSLRGLLGLRRRERRFPPAA